MLLRLIFAPLLRHASGSGTALASCALAAAALSSTIALYRGASDSPARALEKAGADLLASPPQGLDRASEILAAALAAHASDAQVPRVLRRDEGGAFALRSPAGRARDWSALLAARLPAWRLTEVARVAGAERRLLAVVRPAAVALSVGVLAACAICLAAALYALLSARRAEWALLAALGATPAKIATLLAGESLVYALAGGLAGGAAGRALAEALARSYFQTSASLGAGGAAAVAGGLAAVTLLALAGPLRSLRGLSPSNALRGE